MMKSIYGLLVSLLLALTSVVGCTATPPGGLPSADLAVTVVSTQPPLPTKTVVKGPIPITVAPFYDSDGPQINVGEYSQRLGNSDLDALASLSREMSERKDTLTPQEMYVLAIRLYDLGEKDGAVYWFYEAQFRAKLFKLAIEPAQMVRVGEPTYELATAYDSFQHLAGDFINGYAGCDLDNWINIATLVMNNNPTPPTLDEMFPDVTFVEQKQWQSVNDNVATGLAVLIRYISENGELIKQQRAQQNMDQYCD